MIELLSVQITQEAVGANRVGDFDISRIPPEAFDGVAVFGRPLRSRAMN